MRALKIVGAVLVALLLILSAALLVMRADLAKEEDARLLAEALATPEPTSTPEPTATPVPTPEATSTPEPTATPEPTPDIPQVDVNSWEYTLVNHWNGIGEYAPTLEAMENDQQFDIRAAEALRSFIAAARAQGLNVFLSSTYRDYNTQAYLYRNKVAQYGEATAWTIVAAPGTSEHQTGLAADITDRYYQLKDSSLENTELYKWMSAHCQEYGFIVRYPKDKQDVTGVIYEPWHFRYVGMEAAAYIMENGLCLEEFVSLYREIYSAENPA